MRFCENSCCLNMQRSLHRMLKVVKTIGDSQNTMRLCFRMLARFVVWYGVCLCRIVFFMVGSTSPCMILACSSVVRHCCKFLKRHNTQQAVFWQTGVLENHQSQVRCSLLSNFVKPILACRIVDFTKSQWGYEIQITSLMQESLFCVDFSSRNSGLPVTCVQASNDLR